MDGIARFPRQLNTTTFLEIIGEKVQKARHKSSKQKYTHNYWRRECLGAWSNWKNGLVWCGMTAETFLYNWSTGEGAKCQRFSVGLFGRRPLGTRNMCSFALVWLLFAVALKWTLVLTVLETVCVTLHCGRELLIHKNQWELNLEMLSTAISRKKRYFSFIISVLRLWNE